MHIEYILDTGYLLLDFQTTNEIPQHEQSSPCYVCTKKFKDFLHLDKVKRSLLFVEECYLDIVDLLCSIVI